MSRPSGRLRDSILNFAVAGTALCSVPSIAGISEWVLDNITSFSIHLFFASLALAGTAAAFRTFRAAVVAAVIAALLAWRIYPAIGMSAKFAAPSATWLVANVHTSNRNHEALIELIKQRDPDVVGLVETNARWLQALDEPLRNYPHRILQPRDDNFGIALYSRLPLIDAQIQNFGIVPTVTATLKRGDREFDLVLVHVLPPVSSDYARDRNEQLARIGALRPRAGHGLIVAGDFNVTPYSPIFRRSFPAERFKRIGGITGTFPVELHSVFRIPIDHALVGGAVAARTTIEREIGSDHLPLIIELSQ